MKPTHVTAALRALALPADAKERRALARHTALPIEPFQWPPVFVFDTETTTDATQRLTFGVYRYYRWSSDRTLECVEEGLFYADELKRVYPRGLAVLKRYTKRRQAEVIPGVPPRLRFFSRREFVDRMLTAVLERDALLVGFNLPFDLTRLAIRAGAARHPLFYGGFSLELGQWIDSRTGEARSHSYRPRIRLKTIDSKRAFMGLSGIKGAGPKRLYTGWPFLDLRTLAFALTGQAMSLESAGRYFGAAQVKRHVTQHGRISAKYIDYCRQDVGATAALLEQLRAEFDRHPITLAPTAAFSPASVGKAYLAAMGVCPPSPQFALPKELIGHAMTSYYGGRAEVRIRRQAVPVVYCDFVSMYPTVNALMGLWELLTAERLKVEEATADVRALLADVTPERVFNPSLWLSLRFLALVEPHDDILPFRARYDEALQTFGIGVNRVTGKGGMWYAGPDLVASTLLKGRPPRILKAIRLVPEGKQTTLRSVHLRGSVPVDPSKEDFFRRVIEARMEVRGDEEMPALERDRLQQALKILANSSGYGIFAELNRQDVPVKERPLVRVFGIGEPFTTKTAAPETLGEYCFPPFATLTTAAARLMLALLERVVTDIGGTYAFCDTDSMAIVATRTGEPRPCERSNIARPRERHAVHALSWAQVDEIVERFELLSPYDRSTFKGSILKKEHVYESSSGKRLELCAFAISAKRYALFTRGRNGTLKLRKVSEHGLGHLRDPRGGRVQSPRDEDSDSPAWIAELWRWLLARELGRPVREPGWFDRPAISRVTVSSTQISVPFARLNAQKTYAESVKPMNFILSAQVVPFGHPVGADPEHFHLLAPYEPDADKWLELPWFDKYSGTPIRVTTDRDAPPDQARVVTYRDVAEAYAVHAEAKSAAPNGTPCARDTRGPLLRRELETKGVVYVGKESNLLDEVEHGLVHHLGEVQSSYLDPSQDEWRTVAIPNLKRMRAKDAARRFRCSIRTIKNLRNGHTSPSPAIRRRVLKALDVDSE